MNCGSLEGGLELKNWAKGCTLNLMNSCPVL